jgi:hypothetical protein
MMTLNRNQNILDHNFVVPRFERELHCTHIAMIRNHVLELRKELLDQPPSHLALRGGLSVIVDIQFESFVHKSGTDFKLEF